MASQMPAGDCKFGSTIRKRGQERPVEHDAEKDEKVLGAIML